MDWRDQGIIIATRKHGETALIMELLTKEHGRHAGIVRGGASRKWLGSLQAGNTVQVEWRARLAEHLGHYTPDLLHSRAGIMGNRQRLCGLNAFCAMVRFALVERLAVPDFYQLSHNVLFEMEIGAQWAAAYAIWELNLLSIAGYGLDLTQCAVTGKNDDLCYVSPKTGRAVSRDGAGEWVDRLLVLPDFLRKSQLTSDQTQIADALRLTGYFLTQRIALANNKAELPLARTHFIEQISKNSPLPSF